MLSVISWLCLQWIPGVCLPHVGAAAHAGIAAGAILLLIVTESGMVC
jgi:membrane associated rhomboid family serine protease